MVEYEPMYDDTNQRYSCWGIITLIGLYVTTTSLVFIAWNSAYSSNLQFPPQVNNVPDWWIERTNLYAKNIYDYDPISHDFRLVKNQTARAKIRCPEEIQNVVHPEIISINKSVSSTNAKRLVCYYAFPIINNDIVGLRLSDVHSDLCTHINIGFANLRNSSITLSSSLVQILKEDVPVLRAKNTELKLLLCVGGADSGSEFSVMVKNHNTRKIFIQSLKKILSEYSLDGVDLDWEFPSAYNKERQHFSQLLYEIKEEYRRERKNYLLTLAVAAPEGIALFAYDVNEINKYADYASLMTYDYHFYSDKTPFTGLNAPLYARSNEHSLLATLNINYSVHWWLANGLSREKLVVGLPTYGHSFTLVNPFNNVLGAPAQGVGRCGSKGFTSYSELCWFKTHNIGISMVFDKQACSPYLSSGTEWISFENEESISCKTRYVKANNLGGVMAFSLNTDDIQNMCPPQMTAPIKEHITKITAFPLIETIKRNLLHYR